MTARPLVILLMALLPLAGCELDQLTVGPDGLNARVRFMNASRGSPPLTLFLDDQPFVAGVEYGDASPYLVLEPALYSIRMGAGDNAETANAGAVVSGTFRPVAGVTYTLFAAGPGGAPLALLAVDTGAVPAPGKAKVRAVHAAPRAPAIDVHLVGTGRAPDETTRLVTPFTFGVGASYEYPGYVERDPGRYHLIITFEGTTHVLLDYAPIDLAADQARTIVVLDGEGSAILARVVADRN